MVAGIVFALSNGTTIADATRYGIAADAATIMTEGTELCRQNDTERLYKEMTESTASEAYDGKVVHLGRCVSVCWVSRPSSSFSSSWP